MWKQSAFLPVYGSIWGVPGISAQIHGSENDKFIFIDTRFLHIIIFARKK